MDKLNSISIFFPAYNEEGNIGRVIREALVEAKNIAYDYEIIVVNDGSRDKTCEVVQKISKRNPKVKLINHKANYGYGVALRSGFAYSTKEWIFFSDGDGQFYLKDLFKLIKHATDHDIVLGYRHHRQDNFFRLLNANLWRSLIKLVFRLNVRDVNCAFKLFKRSAITPLKLYSTGAMISAELLIQLKQNGYSFKEVAVRHRSRETGSSSSFNPKVILKAFQEFLKFYTNY